MPSSTHEPRRRQSRSKGLRVNLKRARRAPTSSCLAIWSAGSVAMSSTGCRERRASIAHLPVLFSPSRVAFMDEWRGAFLVWDAPRRCVVM